MAERGKLNMVLAVAAVAVLIGSGLALTVTSAPHGDSDLVIVNGREYMWGCLGDDFQFVEFDANGVRYQGVKISDVVNGSGLVAPDTYAYELVSARDGYSKTLAWNDLLNGYLVPEYEKRAVFPERTKSFWIDTIGEINPVAE